MLVGVHSPEFEFEKNHTQRRAAVKQLGVTYPVVFDDDMDIWNAFNNQYWPAKYVTDRKGDIRYVHFGEGEYAQTENVLRLLLGVDKDAPRAKDPTSPSRGPRSRHARDVSRHASVAASTGSSKTAVGSTKRNTSSPRTRTKILDLTYRGRRSEPRDGPHPSEPDVRGDRARRQARA